MKNVAVIVSGMDEEYPYQIMLGINRFARENDINVFYFAAFGGIIESDEFNDGEYSIYNLPEFADFDGALLMTNTFSDPLIREKIVTKVRASGIPVVIFECKEYKEFHIQILKDQPGNTQRCKYTVIPLFPGYGRRRIKNQHHQSRLME